MKKYSTLIITVILLAGGAYYTQQYFIESSASNLVAVATTTNAHPAPTEQAAVAAVANPIETTETNKAEIIPAVVSETPNVTLSISDKAYKLYAPPGTTGLEAMRILASTADFVFTGREYSGMGYFVDSISGKTAADGHVWIFYMNGVKSGKGISSVTLNEGDVIEWRYEKSY